MKLDTTLLALLADLPPKLSTDVRVCYAEATDPDLIAACQAHRIARSDAQKAYFAWAKEKGASSFYLPRDYGAIDVRPSMFVFAEPPNKRSWKEAKNQGQVKGGLAYVPTKFPEGLALKAEIAALPGTENSQKIIGLLGAPDTIRYTKHGGTGFTTVGGGGGVIYFAGLAYAGDRFYVYFPNPFYDLATLAESASTFYSGAEVPDDLVNWRPSEAWTLRSKAEVELVVAQYKVAQEAKAA